MKKLVSIFLAIVLMVSAPFALAESSYTPGTYTAQAEGLNGPVTVEVTFSENAIESVVVAAHKETPGISDGAIEKIPAEIVAGQTLNLDAVSGATYTSNAILNAVADAVAQAGGDAEALRQVEAAASEGQTYEETYDVVVVGAGYGGLCSAVAAAENGASVVLIEKQSVAGGSSAMSGGGVKVAMKQDGENYIQEAYDYWMNEQLQCDPVEGYPKTEFVTAFLEQSEDNLAWLAQQGYEYSLTKAMGAELAFPMTGDTPGSGAEVVNLLAKSAEAHGVDVRMNTKGVEILMENGEATGVRAECGSDTYIFHGKSVILATGGFASSPELIKRFCKVGYNNFSGASAAATGDGILMAEAAGAALYENGWFIGTKGTAVLKYNLGFPLNAFTWKPIMYVGTDGQRFVNENYHYAAIYTEVVKGGHDYYYLIMDSASLTDEEIATLEDGLKEYPEVTFKGETIEELANAAGINAENLAATVNEYNGYQAAGKDAAFGKEPELCTPVSTAPFYATKVKATHLGTMGGVQTNMTMQALDKEGNVIPGLYAVGECANRPFYAEVYTSGTGLGVAVYTGRIAGADAAARK